ncbi:unnamed protein product [Dovyalis caffra]|uniref:anthocyanidin 3-O-glucosyltransferase n=1 Tax=Dovyalis caffra TaxID=77055 RepID=A0AAV1S4K6_9ROSI|nr:unnamed protein product [Dovyalis caffra]
MKKAEMMFIPLPAIGHIVAAVETAKLLVERDDRVSTSVLLINPALHSNTTKYIESLATSTLPNRMRVIDLPTLEPNSRNDNWLTYSIEGQKPHIKAYVTKIKTQSELSPDSPRLAGFVFDMLCTGLKDMANEFGVPWYVFSASSAAFFGCMLHLLYLHDEQKVELSEFKNSDVELEIPSLVNRIPARLLPSMVLDKESSTTFLDPARMWKEATGILMNTFIELESHVVNSFSNDRRIPPVYPVGPIVRSEGKGHDKGLDQREDYMAIKQWLDDQPPSSVVFLCFGSWGSFDVNQIKEIAHALERGGYRFLWSLRKQQPQGNVEQSTNYESFQEILSEKFLNRTVDTRKTSLIATKSSTVCKLVETYCKMKKAELVFIPAPIISHAASTVEVAKLLVDRDERLSITFLIMKTTLNTKIYRSYMDSVSAACSRIRFIDLPEAEVDPNLPTRLFNSLIEAHKPHVREEVSKLVTQSELSPDSTRLAGFVLDMFCTSMIDVANEFGVPSYLFFPSAAAFLGLQFYIQNLHDEQKVDPTEFNDSDVELVVPCLANPFPAKVLPTAMLNKDWLPLSLCLIRRFKETKGIMVNTFYELESHAINSFSKGKAPPVYPVGPILNLSRDERSDGNNAHKDIMQWLDHQPSSSVVFLCFGSMGNFGMEQVKEIACGLEQSGYRFLWSLRQPPPKGKREAPSDYVNPQEVLPEGFFDRTAKIGKVIGWAPQIDILAHPSDIEKGIKCLMELDNEKKGKLKEMSEKSRKALMNGGSSYICHAASTVEVAKLLVDRDERLSITFLIMKTTLNTKIYRSYMDSVSGACSRIRFIDLPEAEVDPNLPIRLLNSLIEAHKPYVKEEISKLVIQSELSPDSPRLAGFVLDMFCTSMIDVANEFGVPSYIFFASAAAFLGLEFYIQNLHDEQKVDPTEFKDSDAELVLPCLANPLPAKVLPFSLFDRDRLPVLLRLVRRYKETKVIILNTFYELESHAISSFSNGKAPPVYPVGPILNLNRDERSDRNDAYKDIMQWLDHQPSSSVVFLCFGSMGNFGMEQVREIACGLEQSGYPFLWSLRQPPPKGKIEAPSDYVNPQEVLPEGFLDRTAKIGKVIGWAPQVDILAHPSLGLAVEIKMDYVKQFNMDDCEIVSAEDIKKGIKCLMELDDEKRGKLKEMSGKSRKALMNGGSSYIWLGRLIQDMIDSMP